MMLCSDGVTGFKSAAYTRKLVALLPVEIGPATDPREITIEVAARWRRAGRYTGVWSDSTLPVELPQGPVCYNESE